MKSSSQREGDRPSARTANLTSDVSPFLASLQCDARVRGSTHTFYRYPARFSPDFARQAVLTFSRPNDLVLDPFMGGGTSAVESLAEGRRFLGNDINQLAHFVSTVKTTLLSGPDEAAIIEWAANLRDRIDLGRPLVATEEATYAKLPWWLRRLFGHSLATLEHLTPRQQAFARCTLLSTAQWALDCKSTVPSSDEVLTHHEARLGEMLHGLQEFSARLRLHRSRAALSAEARRLVCMDAAQLARHQRVRSFGKPTLVLTSPPYLGVHVLYHRWQILGRRETSAPYWLANRADGQAGMFYTFADRKAANPSKYLERLKRCFGALAELADAKTLIVQLVAFRDPDIQLPLYLKALGEIGLEKCDVVVGGGKALTRDVPNRKWYANLGVQSSSSVEFLVVHRRSRNSRKS